MERSSTVIKARSTHYVTGYHDGGLVKIIFYKDTLKGVQNYLKVHGGRCCGSPVLTLENLATWSPRPSAVRWWVLENHSLTVSEEQLGGDAGPVQVLSYKGEKYLIKNLINIKKCDECGTPFVKTHNCNFRKRQFYHHAILPDTKCWWKPIRFTPLGCLETAERLFVIYDIETYTYHSAYGKQLVPYLLVLTFKGDKRLRKEAEAIASSTGFTKYRNCFLILDKEPDRIGKSFKKLRIELQKKVASLAWKQFKERQSLEDEETTFEHLQTMAKEGRLKLDAEPSFMEIYVIGHNICGFDEIVLASHVLEGLHHEDSFKMFRIRRNFMPRAGKLLFNDITMALPNPSYAKPKGDTFARWKKGILLPCDVKWQGVKFMVRDTFLLTHSSLRNCAKAYQLQVSKGHCPYGALNEHFMTGTYLHDENGYPARKYWDNDTEYEENKPLPGETYDLVQKAVDYCVDDVRVTEGLVKKLICGYQTFCTEVLDMDCTFNIFQRPTISSTTHCMFKQVYYSSEEECGLHLRNLEAPSEAMYEHVRQSVRGGRCYPSFLGVFENPIYVYDICGMYASALSHPMPHGPSLNPFDAMCAIQTFQTRLDSREKLSYFDKEIKPMIVVADCFPPDLTELDVLPPLCSRKSGKLCWTNEELLGEVLTTVDLIMLHNRGWKVKLHKHPELYAVWPEWKCICKDYVSINIAAKEKADRENNQTQRSISKLLSNALYGSFATRLDNKQVLFLEDMGEKVQSSIRSGEASIVSMTSVCSNSLPQTDHSPWKEFFNLPQVGHANAEELNGVEDSQPFIGGEKGHVTFKPITFLSAECESLLLATVESNSDWVKNDRYATQIASFVLAWSRAFMSEWATILYEDDWGKPYSDREPKSVYGDTDSLFLTEAGHRLMTTKGASRLKSSGNSLVYQGDGRLAWLVECETKCSRCSADAYSSESCFLAPKLYALKDTTCPACGEVNSGKLRAKGHAKSSINYDLLKTCFLDYYLLDRPTEVFQSERTSLKRTLVNATGAGAPFTVVEKQLVRILRPWNDMTMRKGEQLHRGYLLFPYDQKYPNPRPQETLQENPFWEDS